MGMIARFVCSAFAWAFYLQPRRLQLFWGRAIGWILRALSLRKGVIEQNLCIAFPGEGDSSREARIGDAYRHLGFLITELLLLFGPMDRFIRRWGELRGAENWSAAHQLGRGVIFISSHVGNWEVMSGSGGLLGGIDLMIVTKLLKPAWLHQGIEQGRLRCHYAGTYEPRTMKDVLRHLNRGATVGFVMDQYSGPPVGVRVPVFGVPVGTPAAIATLAKRAACPVLPVVNYRSPNGRFVTDIRPPISWEKCEDPRLEVATNTARFAEQLEKDIYAHPEQWLWTHRRFKGELGPLRPGEWLEGRSRS